jgi:hypothetical protein
VNRPVARVDRQRCKNAPGIQCHSEFWVRKTVNRHNHSHTGYRMDVARIHRQRCTAACQIYVKTATGGLIQCDLDITHGFCLRELTTEFTYEACLLTFLQDTRIGKLKFLFFNFFQCHCLIVHWLFCAQNNSKAASVYHTDHFKTFNIAEM